ncbi:MAG: cell division protein FtsA [Chloroflexi bacterium]|nr:cell division protein FtsA [Chloroflexota bacterium]
MARERLVVGIDVGTSKICTLIASVTADDQLDVIGVGVTRSDGIKKGVVVSVEEAARQIQASVQKAEQQSGFKILSAYVTISGSHIRTDSGLGVATIRRQDGAISDHDVARALEAARAVVLPPDRELIDVVPRQFSVDGQEGIASPVGMVGHRLEVQTVTITGAHSAMQGLTSSVERAGVGIDALILSSLGAGGAVLAPTERDLGVTLIDLGGGTTDIAIFSENALLTAASLGVGGAHITSDIAARFRTPFSAAEEVKVRHGQAFFNERDEDRTIDLTGFETGETQAVPLRTLCETIEDRLADTFERVRDRLVRSGFEESLPAGAVLVGGAAQMPGIRRLAAEILESPVRIGVPSGIYGLADQISTPAFAASAGLLRWGLVHGEEGGSRSLGPGLGPVVESVQRWLGRFFH